MLRSVRYLVQVCLGVLMMASVSNGVVLGQSFRLYIGTYTGDGSISEGIYTATFDSASGKLSAPELAARTVSPSFLAIHPGGEYLYAVNETVEGTGRANGQVSAFRIEADGQLTFLNQLASFGGAPCHCVVDGSGRFLLVANYVGGNVVVYPIDASGKLGAPVSNIWHEGKSIDESRQEGPHAHSVNLSPDNRYAYVADLGIDRIVVYRFNSETGALEPAEGPHSVVVSERASDGTEKRKFSTAAAEVTRGGGPRHFAIHPRGQFAYSNNELTATVSVFKRDQKSGLLERIEEYSTLPENAGVRKSTAECLVDPTGRYLYVSNRGHDSIAAFAIDQETGDLTPMEITATGGEEPRNFVIDPTGQYLLAENQNSDTVIVHELSSGRMTSTSVQVKVGKPVCIRFLAVKR